MSYKHNKKGINASNCLYLRTIGRHRLSRGLPMAQMKGIINPSHQRTSALQLLLLVLLDESPKYGYEMLKIIKEDFKGIWDLKTGTLYPALKSLDRHGLVVMQKKDEMDFYYITETGTKLLSMIGYHQEAIIRFSERFIVSITKHMSKNLKKKVFDSITSLSKYDIDWTQASINLLEGFDNDSKIELLKAMQANITKRLSSVNEIILELEGT